MAHQASAAKQAVVIGGSLGGLFAGLLLRSIRDVDIYERSPQDLDSRGGGIVLQPEVLRRSAALAFNMTPRDRRRVEGAGVSRPHRRPRAAPSDAPGADLLDVALRRHAPAFPPSITTKAPSSPTSRRAPSGSKPVLPMAAR